MGEIGLNLFITDYFGKEWSDVLQRDNINLIINDHASWKQVDKHELKFKTKPWITLAFQKSTTAKSNLLKNFINSKDPRVKETLHDTELITETFYLYSSKKAKQIKNTCT